MRHTNSQSSNVFLQRLELIHSSLSFKPRPNLGVRLFLSVTTHCFYRTQTGRLIRLHDHNFKRVVMVKMGLLGTGSVKITMEKVTYLACNSGALQTALNGLEVKKRRRFPWVYASLWLACAEEDCISCRHNGLVL